MARVMPLIYLALGLTFVCLLLVVGMPTIYPSVEWTWIASTVVGYIILLALLGGAFYVLASYLGRR